MAEADSTQLNIRSRFARARAAGIARDTGMTLTQVVEEALRAYQPASRAADGERLAARAGILVRRKAGRTVSSREVETAIEALRGARG